MPTAVAYTYEQIAQAVVALPFEAQKRLLELLMAQPGVRADWEAARRKAFLEEGAEFERRWIEQLKRVPDDPKTAEDWIDSQAWSDE